MPVLRNGANCTLRHDSKDSDGRTVFYIRVETLDRNWDFVLSSNEVSAVAKQALQDVVEMQDAAGDKTETAKAAMRFFRGEL